MHLSAESLTVDSFAPFGQVLTLPSGQGRVDYSHAPENRRPAQATLCFRTSLTEPTELPFRAIQMERHRYSSQAFLPVDVARYLVLVAPHGDGGGPDMRRARLFHVDGRTGINYAPDVWHHPMTVLDRPAIFATVMFVDGGPDDEEFVDLPEPVTITLP
ncbi:MAG: ureidoglycolate lyase [Alphaproteobacteria bacterium]|nr:ureidoglycolate lyase [Alphaproteobacteria bacterium]